VFVDGIIVNLQCGSQRNGSTTDHKFCFRETVEKNCDGACGWVRNV